MDVPRQAARAFNAMDQLTVSVPHHYSNLRKNVGGHLVPSYTEVGEVVAVDIFNHTISAIINRTLVHGIIPSFMHYAIGSMSGHMPSNGTSILIEVYQLPKSTSSLRYAIASIPSAINPFIDGVLLVSRNKSIPQIRPFIPFLNSGDHIISSDKGSLILLDGSIRQLSADIQEDITDADLHLRRISSPLILRAGGGIISSYGAILRTIKDDPISHINGDAFHYVLDDPGKKFTDFDFSSKSAAPFTEYQKTLWEFSDHLNPQINRMSDVLDYFVFDKLPYVSEGVGTYSPPVSEVGNFKEVPEITLYSEVDTSDSPSIAISPLSDAKDRETKSISKWFILYNKAKDTSKWFFDTFTKWGSRRTHLGADEDRNISEEQVFDGAVVRNIGADKKKGFSLHERLKGGIFRKVGSDETDKHSVNAEYEGGLHFKVSKSSDGFSVFIEGTGDGKIVFKDVELLYKAGAITVTNKADYTQNTDGKLTFNIKGPAVLKSDSAITVESPMSTIKGGTVKVGGLVSPSGSGPFCGLPKCLFTGADHIGDTVAGA